MHAISLSDVVSAGLPSVVAGPGGWVACVGCGTWRVPGDGGAWVAMAVGGAVTIDGRLLPDVAFGPCDGRGNLDCAPGAGLLFCGFVRPLPVGAVSAGSRRLLALFLRGVAATLDQLAPTDLQPIETAVRGFLTAPKDDPVPRGARASFQRMVRAIEPRLSNPALSLSVIAREQGVSERYLRRVFEVAGTRFGDYVRARRLEHCKAELDDPALAAEPVASIGFRWGFNDPAHFSRAFRERFGMPPRAWRDRARQGRGNCQPNGRPLPASQSLAV